MTAARMVGVWKAIGDEIVFRAGPRTIDEALRIVDAFCRTMTIYKGQAADRWDLRLRGGIWAARLPGRNIEISF